MLPITPGQIVWAVPPGDRGDGKVRPCIIATDWGEICRGSLIRAVVCSSQFDYRQLKPTEVLLPADREGRTLTKFTTPTVAVCDWIVLFPPGTDFTVRRGRVCGAFFREICKRAGILLPNRR